MRMLAAALLSLLAPLAFAQTVSDPGWTLNGAGTPYATQAACILGADLLPLPAPGATSKAACADTTTITRTTPLPPASAAGAYLRGPTSSAALTDTVGTAWTLNGGIVYDQLVTATAAAKAGFTGGVGLLLWDGSKIHQQNQACLWWDWTGSTWASEAAPPTAPPCAGVSPSGTIITGAGQSIVDATLTTWTIQAGVVYSQPSAGAAAPAGFSANVIALAYVGGKIYQENAACQWYGWTAGAASPWAAVSAPAVTGPTCPATPPPPAASLGIKVHGATFTDLTGNVLQLQGENVTAIEISYANSMWDAYYATTVATWKSILTAWHMNIIRLPLNEWAWRTNAPSAKGVAYQTIVATAVANINAAGAYVILDLHWAAPNAYTGNLSGNNAAGYADGQPGYIDADNGVNFWTSVATAYKNNPAVLFELFNEPYGDNSGGASSYQYLKNGSGTTQVPFLDQAEGKGTGQSTGKNYAVVGHQQLVTAIRATGATNVILYSCPVWDSEPSQSLAVEPTDPLNQLGATVHYANGSNADYTNILNAGIPIIMTEFYTLASRGGYPWAQAAHIGYVMWGANNWNSNADLSSLITASPWSFNSASVAWQ